MRTPKALLALCLSLFVMACSTSSPQPQAESQALTKAEDKVQERLDHPAPPSRLLLCQDGSTPQMIGETWECPPPPEVLHALKLDSLQDQVATLIGALRKETDLRFQLYHWDWPPPATAGAVPPGAP